MRAGHLTATLITSMLIACQGAGGDDTSDSGTVVCDPSSHLDLGNAVRGAHSLVIARDGTLYFGQPQSIGRRLPDGTLDAEWVALPDPVLVVGLTLDASNETLFAASRSTTGSTQPLLRIDVATGTITSLGAGSLAAALTMGADGRVYYATTGAVMRVDPMGGASTRVTIDSTTDFDSPQGLAFAPDGTLVVADHQPTASYLYRITLGASGLESSREQVPHLLSNLVGIAIDARGRLYVTTIYQPSTSGNALFRIDADGGNQELLSDTLTAPSMDFGHGALCSTDLFIADDVITRVPTDTPGAPVPWH